MESVWSVSKLSTESVGSRRQLVAIANCVHTTDADATKQFRRVGVGGVYWALQMFIISVSKCLEPCFCFFIIIIDSAAVMLGTKFRHCFIPEM